jgi:hypothetical protein
MKFSLFNSVFVLLEILDHGGSRGDTAQALARWRHPVASSEAWMCFIGQYASHCTAASAWQSKSPANSLHFLLLPIRLLPTNIAK